MAFFYSIMKLILYNINFNSMQLIKRDVPVATKVYRLTKVEASS